MSGGSRERKVATTVAQVALAVAVVGLVGAGLVGTVLAGDTLAYLSATPQEIDAQPGEQFEVDVHLRSESYRGGVESVTLRALYHPEYLQVVDVEPAGWLEGENTTVETERTVANDRGVTVLEQYRGPPEGGASGEGVFATLTVRVNDDAPASNATIGFRESDVTLTDDYIAVRDHPVTVAIDGGGDEHGEFDHGNLTDVEGEEPPVEVAGGDDGSDDTEDALPGFSLLAAGLSVLAVAAIAIRRRLA